MNDAVARPPRSRGARTARDGQLHRALLLLRRVHRTAATVIAATREEDVWTPDIGRGGQEHARSSCSRGSRVKIQPRLLLLLLLSPSLPGDVRVDGVLEPTQVVIQPIALVNMHRGGGGGGTLSVDVSARPHGDEQRRRRIRRGARKEQRRGARGGGGGVPTAVQLPPGV